MYTRINKYLDIHIQIKQIFNEYLEFEYPKIQATIKAAVLIKSSMRLYIILTYKLNNQYDSHRVCNGLL